VSSSTETARHGGLDPIEALLAIEEIKQLRARYFQTLDGKDWPAWEALFTDDVKMDFSQERVYQVRDLADRDALPADAFTFTSASAAAEAFSGTLGGAVTVHQGHDPQITLTGPDTATGLWSMWDCLDYGHELFQGYGHYHETYRKVDGRWLIATIKLTRMRTVWEPIEHRWTR
jgi:hypothetical protein